MYQVSFDFHGVQVSLSASQTNAGIAKKAMEWIAEDFNFFLIPNARNYEIEFRLLGTPSPYSLPGIPVFKTRMCRAFGFGSRRICNYGDGSIVEALSRPEGRRVFNVYSQNENELYEFTYVALLSAIGEALDRKKFHRVHALGISNQGSAVLVHLPSGGGKSSLASAFLKQGEFSILSDESPLLKDGKVYPFPNHVALAAETAKELAPKTARLFKRKYFPSKMVFSIPLNKISAAQPLQAVLFGRRTRGAPKIIRISKWKAAIHLFKDVVVGAGLVQMAEFMLRTDNIWNLTKIAFSRLNEATKILRNTPCYEFKMSPNLEENANALKEFLVTSELKSISFSKDISLA